MDRKLMQKNFKWYTCIAQKEPGDFVIFGFRKSKY
jgi:hypothetical protein